MVVVINSSSLSLKRMTLRKEDYDVSLPRSEMEDILQFNTKPGTAMYRGVQIPAAFMATAGGIDKARFLVFRAMPDAANTLLLVCLFFVVWSANPNSQDPLYPPGCLSECRCEIHGGHSATYDSLHK